MFDADGGGTISTRELGYAMRYSDSSTVRILFPISFTVTNQNSLSIPLVLTSVSNNSTLDTQVNGYEPHRGGVAGDDQ